MAALTFSDLSPDDLKGLGRFAALPFQKLFEPSREQIESHWLGIVSELVTNENTIGIAARSGQVTCGFAICTPLEWESAILEKKMYAVKHIGFDSDLIDVNRGMADLVAEVSRRAAAKGADFLLCKTTVSDTAVIHALESNGFLLMDTLLDFVCDCRKVRAHKNIAPELPDGFVLRLAGLSDVDQLRETARASFTRHFGRFHADSRIGRDAATRIYEEWIVSCAKGWADSVYVVTNGERVAGYSAWKKSSAVDVSHGFRLGHYSIGAVHPDFFARGLFTALTRAGMEGLCEFADWIEGPTHIENHPVQRGYLRLGWQIAGAQHSFHKWLTD